MPKSKKNTNKKGVKKKATQGRKRSEPRKRLIKDIEADEQNQITFSPFLKFLVFVVSSYVFLSLLSEYYLRYSDSEIRQNMMGSIGQSLSSSLIFIFGISCLVPLLLLLSKFLSTLKDDVNDTAEDIAHAQRSSALVILSFCTIVTSVSVLLQMVLGVSGGGILGHSLYNILLPHLNIAGVILLSSSVLFFSTLYFFNTHMSQFLDWLLTRTKNNCIGFFQICSGMKNLFLSPFATREVLSEVELDTNFTLGTDEIDNSDSGTSRRRIKKVGKALRRKTENDPAPVISRGSFSKANSAKPKKLKTPALIKYPNYKYPTRDLLVGTQNSNVTGPQDEELYDNSTRLEQALSNFKLGGRIVEVHPGPIVTLYQFEPAAGIKVQRIISLADDLALALKVESVRVYAPVPGKGTVGIEVPNSDREIVRLRDVIDSEDYTTKPYILPLALGKDTYGKPFIADLCKMPHLLIAGATGTGKSVCINSLLMSLLFNNSPEQLRLILIDPKMLELSTYESIPHLLSPVITQAKRARGVLYWAVEEMERRYAIMKKHGVRDLSMYNKVVSKNNSHSSTHVHKRKASVITLEEKDVVATASGSIPVDRAASESDSFDIDHDGAALPRIVIIVDELADLMLTVGKEIEELLTRLAQKARAAGIHLVLATQRPSVNVITGLIKANFPARVSFKVAGRIDSRTVLDQSGSERLLGQGDMLFMSPALGRLRRLHSPFVSDQEVHDVVSWIKSQGAPNYDPEIEKVLTQFDEAEKNQSSSRHGDNEDHDPLYDQAVNLVVEKGQASTSMVQRVFRIGYNRAARILETMEEEGVVGPADGSKRREVLLNNMDGSQR